jgi:hypothetical protein
MIVLARFEGRMAAMRDDRVTPTTLALALTIPVRRFRGG